MSKDHLNFPKKNKPKTAPTYDLDSSLEKLAHMLAKDRKLIEKDLVSRGDEMLGFFSDKNMRDTYKDFDSLRIEVIKLAANDLAKGASALRRSTLGLTLTHGRIRVFIEAFGCKPQGNVVFSINLKTSFAFSNWRKDPGVEFSQEDTNAAVYRLATLWSEIIREVI